MYRTFGALEVGLVASRKTFVGPTARYYIYMGKRPNFSSPQKRYGLNVRADAFANIPKGGGDTNSRSAMSIYLKRSNRSRLIACPYPEQISG